LKNANNGKNPEVTDFLKKLTRSDKCTRASSGKCCACEASLIEALKKSDDNWKSAKDDWFRSIILRDSVGKLEGYILNNSTPNSPGINVVTPHIPKFGCADRKWCDTQYIPGTKACCHGNMKCEQGCIRSKFTPAKSKLCSLCRINIVRSGNKVCFTCKNPTPVRPKKDMTLCSTCKVKPAINDIRKFSLCGSCKCYIVECPNQKVSPHVQYSYCTRHTPNKPKPSRKIRINTQAKTCRKCGQTYNQFKDHVCPTRPKRRTNYGGAGHSNSNSHRTSYGSTSGYGGGSRGCFCQQSGMNVSTYSKKLGQTVRGCGQRGCMYARRRLADVAQTLQHTQHADQSDDGSMSPSERFLRRRRLACPYRDSPVLLQLMEEIMQARERHQN